MIHSSYSKRRKTKIISININTKANFIFLLYQCKRYNELTQYFSCSQNVIQCKKLVFANTIGGKIELQKKLKSETKRIRDFQTENE